VAAAIMSPSGRDREWREVLRLWEKLDETQREEVVKLARALLEAHRRQSRLPDQGGTQ